MFVFSYNEVQRGLRSVPGGPLEAVLPLDLPEGAGVLLLDVPLQVSAVVPGDLGPAAHDLAQGLVGRGLEGEVLPVGVLLVAPHGPWT